MNRVVVPRRPPVYPLGMPKRAGFSMVELMVTVAIIGVLAAIAIPSWRQSQLRAKKAEVPPNVQGIRIAEQAYYAAFDTFVAEVQWYPSDLTYGAADKTLEDWPSPDSAGGFSTIGWHPYGAVRGSYSVPDGDSDSFEVQGMCNVDGDGDAPLYWCTEADSCDWDPGDIAVY